MPRIRSSRSIAKKVILDSNYKGEIRCIRHTDLSREVNAYACGS
jgi:hypothetical protein